MPSRGWHHNGCYDAEYIADAANSPRAINNQAAAHLSVQPPHSWMDNAACRLSDAAAFFDTQHPTAALTICHTCPVQEPCGEFMADDRTCVAGGQNRGEAGRARVAPKIMDAILPVVAQVYRETITGSPSIAVADYFGLQRSTAYLYVQRARDAGYGHGRMTRRASGS